MGPIRGRRNRSKKRHCDETFEHFEIGVKERPRRGDLGCFQGFLACQKERKNRERTGKAEFPGENETGEGNRETGKRVEKGATRICRQSKNLVGGWRRAMEKIAKRKRYEKAKRSPTKLRQRKSPEEEFNSLVGPKEKKTDTVSYQTRRQKKQDALNLGQFGERLSDSNPLLRAI